MIHEFIATYGLDLLYAAIIGIASSIAYALKNIYQNKINDSRKKDAVEICVKAVEQLYKDLDGAGKLQKAKESVVEMLEAKGISISEVEMDLLIEAVVAEFNFNDIKITGSSSTADADEDEEGEIYG